MPLRCSSGAAMLSRRSKDYSAVVYSPQQFKRHGTLDGHAHPVVARSI
jgi:hypothetical protein